MNAHSCWCDFCSPAYAYFRCLRATPWIGDTFGPVDEEIEMAFLPALFEVVGDGDPGREITRLPVKQAGMALPDPTRTAPEKWQASCVITGHLVSALRGQVPFRTADHAAFLWYGRLVVRRPEWYLPPEL